MYFCRIFEDLLSISSIDSLLLPQLVYICPKKELNFLFLRIPAVLSSVFINQVLLDPKQLRVRNSLNNIVSSHNLFKLGSIVLYLHRVLIHNCVS